MAEFSTLDNQQFGQTANPAGGALLPAPAGGGFGRKPLTDDDGRSIVRVADAAGYVDGGFSTRFQLDSGALVAQQDIFAGAGQIAVVTGFNSSALLRYVQLYDLAAGPIPLLTAPDISIATPRESQFSLAIPWRFANGCVIGISTMPDEFITGGVVLWWNAIFNQ